MYRSFVTCDDPKGVIECGTLRKFKSVSQQMEDKIKSHRRTQRKSDTSSASNGKKEEMVPKGSAEDYQGPSSVQLVELSRGAHKLNHLIDSWSKGLACDGQSRDIAKDLLKGALDLQESLNMLGKLQEASQYVARLKKKQKQLERGRSFDVSSGRISSERFGDQHRPRLSTNGSSRDCIEELRNAIRDGLAKQNLPANTSSQEKMKFDRRKVESVSHKPSTSSSYSSAVWSDNSHTGSSSSQTTLQEKGKSPNLIARLMGLEDVPSKTMMQSPVKKLTEEKNLIQHRPVFDAEMPKLRKPPSVVQKVNSERRTLREILETAQFQGLLKSSSPKESKSKSHHSGDFHHKRSLLNDSYPIVLIKPTRVSHSESEEETAPLVFQEGPLSRKMLLRKMKMKEELDHSSVDEKQASSDFSNMNRRAEAEETPVERIIQEEGIQNRLEKVPMPVEKQVIMINQKEGAMSVNKVQRKLKAEATPRKRLDHEGAKDHKKAVNGKEVRKKSKDFSEMIVSSPASNQLRKKEATDRKEDKVQKMVVSCRKPAEKETVKGKIVSKSPDQAKLTSTRLKKSDTGSITTNDNKDRKQKEKQGSEHVSAEPTTDIVECKEDKKRMDVACTNHSQKEEPSPITAEERLSAQEGTDASEFQTTDHFDDRQSSTCDISMPTTEYELHSESPKEVDEQMTPISTYSTSPTAGSLLKNLLLSSVSFLNRAEEVFHLNMSQPTTLPTSGFHDSAVLNIKLSLDYANEFIERRSLPDSQKTPLPSTYTGNSRVRISLDRLVDEVCSGVETLRKYHRLHADSLYATLERDIMCKEVVSGIWDLGWRKFCSSEEFELTVNEIEKLLVGELIEELLS